MLQRDGLRIPDGGQVDGHVPGHEQSDVCLDAGLHRGREPDVEADRAPDPRAARKAGSIGGQASTSVGSGARTWRSVPGPATPSDGMHRGPAGRAASSGHATRAAEPQRAGAPLAPGPWPRSRPPSTWRGQVHHRPFSLPLPVWSRPGLPGRRASLVTLLGPGVSVPAPSVPAESRPASPSESTGLSTSFSTKARIVDNSSRSHGRVWTPRLSRWPVEPSGRADPSSAARRP